MSEIAHTAGPWHMEGKSGNDGEAMVIVSKDRTIAWTAATWDEASQGDVITPEDEANAKLVAAAPELLESLQLVMDIVATRVSSLSQMDYSKMRKARAVVVQLQRR